jgi:nitrogenase iron protein NifH
MVGGLINNMRGVENEEEIVEAYAERLGVKVLAHIPRSHVVQEAEEEGGTVVEKQPDSEQAAIYRRLAENVLNNKDLSVPDPMNLEEVLALIKQYTTIKATKQEIDLTPRIEITQPTYDLAELGRKDKTLKKIAVYGKGGIGKSTTSSNISASASRMGETVLQMGCDPKRDSIATLCGKLKPTILDTMREHEGEMTEDLMSGLVHQGFNGALGIESGGPRPGVGCAGAGVMEALRIFEKYDIINKHNVTFAVFDVLGDVVCGGFAQPMRAGYAREVYIVTCGEILTLVQINNIAKSIQKVHDRGGDCACAGIINNMRGVKNEEKIVELVAEKMGLPVVAHVPRSQTVQDAEFYSRTVVELYPDSEQAKVYTDLTKKILENTEVFIPKALSLKEIRELIGPYM